MTTTTLVRARWLICSPERVLRDAALLVRGGRVERVLDSPSAIRRTRAGARELDFGDSTVAPGLVNAHAHLELTGLAGRTQRGADFAAWVRSVISARAARTPEQLELDARRGADQALRSGTTCVLDIDATGAALRGLAGHPLRRVQLREVLDAYDSARTGAAIARVTRALPRRVRRWEGLAPHAPFTVSPALLAAVGRIAARRALPVQVHWSETQAEVEWLWRGTGPLAALLGSSPKRSGLELLASAGLLGPRLSLVHGNHPLPGEARTLAACGATLVHCPGSHAWFARAPFDWRGYARAGVRVALGTDSLASNVGLDLFAELRRAAAEQPWLRPAALWSAATEAGARAAGRAGELGVLAVGACADWIVVPCSARAPAALLEELCSGSRAAREVWIGGRRADGGSGQGSRDAGGGIAR